MATLEVRPALLEDREPILAFCQQTWSWGDYVQFFWDDWLSSPSSTLLVATLDEQPVGMVHLEMLNDAEAWLEALRVDPRYRRQGIATTLNAAVIREAGKQGASVVRMAVRTDNPPSMSLATTRGFQRVGTFSLYAAGPLSEREQQRSSSLLRSASVDDRQRIVAYLQDSYVFPIVGGSYARDFRSLAISDSLLDEKIQARQVLLLERWGRLEGFALIEPCYQRSTEKFYLEVGYIDGLTIEAISIIAHEMRRYLITTECELVRIYAPELVLVRDALPGLGYTYEDETFYLYERELE